MTVSQTINKNYGACSVYFKVTAEFERDGDNVTITFRYEYGGSGVYYRGWLDDELIFSEETGSFSSEPYTFYCPDAQTYELELHTMCQVGTGWPQNNDYATLTISIPAIATRMYVASGGTVKTSTEIYAVENNTPKRVREIYSVSGGAVRRVT